MLEESVQILQNEPIAGICGDMFGMVDICQAGHTKVLQYAVSIEQHS
jgi:hypothetical protein